MFSFITFLDFKLQSISPGLVETNIASHEPALKDFAKKLISLMPDDVADAVMYALKTRPDVEVNIFVY